MSRTPDDGSAPVHVADLRRLPARPNLEHERKEAKALVRLPRQGDRDAIERVRARETDAHASAPGAFRLADAQRTIAREYGFASWPKLVSYYEALLRQER